jgi:hypothetical protein
MQLEAVQHAYRSCVPRKSRRIRQENGRQDPEDGKEHRSTRNNSPSPEERERRGERGSKPRNGQHARGRGEGYQRESSKRSMGRRSLASLPSCAVARPLRLAPSPSTSPSPPVALGFARPSLFFFRADGIQFFFRAVDG